MLKGKKIGFVLVLLGLANCAPSQADSTPKETSKAASKTTSSLSPSTAPLPVAPLVSAPEVMSQKSPKEGKVPTAETEPYIEADVLMPDPFEPFNRVMFEFNYFIDGVFLNPAAHVYQKTTPHVLRRGVSNVLSNLWCPITLLNNILQGKPHSACETFARFFVNTILGLGGIFDVAELLGLPENQEDFAQTLTVWGMDPGPYLVLPIIGSTSGRDVIGRAVDSLTDPFNAYMFHHHYDHNVYIRTGIYVISARSQAIEAMDSLERSSIDLYATIRSLYQQHRLKNMMGGETEYYTPGPETYADDQEPF